MAELFEKGLKNVENDLEIWEIAQIHGARIKYLRNGFSMLGMALEFDNRLKYVGNDECMWEMA